MKDNNSKVSVIIATYKRPHLLLRAIDSVLNQTYHNIELIVVDDNDPESEYRRNTELLMSKYKNDTRIIYLLHDKNRNASAARNTGIRASSGKYISFLDDDDYYLPSKTMRLVNILEENQDYSGVYCGWEKGNVNFKPAKDDYLIQNLLLGLTSIYTPTTLFKKEAVISINGWDEKIVRHQDSEFIIRLLSQGYKLFPINEELVVIDEADRTQAPKGIVWENHTKVFLEQMNDYIIKYDMMHKGLKKQVYCNRFLSVMLNYFKCKEPFNALYTYFYYSIRMPFYFNKTIISYLFNKLRRSDTNS